MADNELVVGLDIGTTFTGIAFSEKCGDDSKDQHIAIVQDFPRAKTHNGTSEKVPTEIAYTPSGVRWGFDIPPQTSRHMWTKLQLEGPSTGKAAIIKREIISTSNDEQIQKLPEDIIADFLKCVKQQLLKNLERNYGMKLWKSFSITLVVTFPAVWSDSAKEKTLRAVSKAGFNKDELPKLASTITVTEPEAAAMYTLKSLKGTRMLESLKTGAGFIICDMGGGTVDLIAYRVTGVGPIAIEEATVGTGQQCGGTFVDRGFLKWLEKKLGHDDFEKISDRFSAEQLPHIALPAKLGKMMQEFRQAKCDFEGNEDFIISLPYPLSEIQDDERGMIDGELMISKYDMTEMFQFSLTRTRELIEDQIRHVGRSGKTDIKYIFMVGGFAASPFMYNQLKTLGNGYGIEVISPLSPWSAVPRGAVCKGLEKASVGTIQVRKCRRHYGTSCTTAFNRRKHSGQQAYTCPYDGTKRADNQITYIMHKGQDLASTSAVHGTHSLAHNTWSKTERTMTVTLLGADTDNAPTTSTDTNVYTVAELHVDLRDVPNRLYRKKRNAMGKTYCELEFDVNFAIQSHIEYSVSIGGQSYGSITAQYT